MTSPPNPYEDYNWSINLTQAIIAFLEGVLIGEKPKKAAVLAIVIAISSVIPEASFTSMKYNEKLWETVLATILGGITLTSMYDGGFAKNAIISFVIDTSSMAFTDEIYNSYILGGNNLSVLAQRAAYPNPTAFNRVVLG